MRTKFQGSQHVSLSSFDYFSCRGDNRARQQSSAVTLCCHAVGPSPYSSHISHARAWPYALSTQPLLLYHSFHWLYPSRCLPNSAWTVGYEGSRPILSTTCPMRRHRLTFSAFQGVYSVSSHTRIHEAFPYDGFDAALGSRVQIQCHNVGAAVREAAIPHCYVHCLYPVRLTKELELNCSRSNCTSCLGVIAHVLGNLLWLRFGVSGMTVLPRLLHHALGLGQNQR